MSLAAVIAVFTALSLALLACNENKQEDVEIDMESEKLIRDFLESHTIDSAESDEEVIARIRRDVAEGKIRRNPKNGDVDYVR